MTSRRLATSGLLFALAAACGAPAPSAEGRFQTVQVISTADGTPPIIAQVVVAVTQGSPNWLVSFQDTSGETCLEEASPTSGDSTLTIVGTTDAGCLFLIDGGAFLGSVSSGTLTVDVDGNLSGLQAGVIASPTDGGARSFVQTNVGARIP